MMVLFVCSLGKLRSRTAELLCLFGGLDARCCGTHAAAHAPVSDALLREASLVVCMEKEHKAALRTFQHYGVCDVVTLGVPDNFNRLDPQLVQALIFQTRFHAPEVADAMARGAEVLAGLPGYQDALATHEPPLAENVAYSVFPC